MKQIKRSIIIGLAISLSITPFLASGWAEDKTYKFNVLHTNDLHGHFWPDEYGEYGLAAQKTIIDKIRRRYRQMVARCWCSLLVILIPGYQNRICSTLNPIFVE